MPAAQEGTVDRPGGRQGAYRARWRDHEGVRRAKSGFTYKTKQAREKAGAGGLSAREFLDEKVAETDAILNGTAVAAAERPASLDELFDVFLDRHGRTVDPATKRKLTADLRCARRAFGTKPPDSLRMAELEDWRETLPAGNRHEAFRHLRQALSWGVARGLVTRDATVGIKNPKRKREERAPVHPYDCRHTFATWAIRDGIPSLTLAKIMGTSVQQLEDTYHRELRGDADRVRGIFDAADRKVASYG